MNSKCIDMDDYPDNPNHLHYDLSQPITHLKNKTFFEKAFSCCLNDHATELSTSEIYSLNKLKIQANTYFNDEYEPHNNLLRELWLIIFKDKLSDVKNSKWKTLGFQSNDPRTDFRGGGILSLHNLLYLCKNYESKVHDMTSIDNSDFLMSITSISITYFLIKYYHLADYLEYDKDKDDICSRKALKNFTKILLDDKNIFNKIHLMLLVDSFENWVLYKRIWYSKGYNNEVNVNDFQIVMNNIKRKFKLTTTNTIYEYFETLERKYKSLANDLTLKNDNF